MVGGCVLMWNSTLTIALKSFLLDENTSLRSSRTAVISACCSDVRVRSQVEAPVLSIKHIVEVLHSKGCSFDFQWVHSFLYWLKACLVQ